LRAWRKSKATDYRRDAEGAEKGNGKLKGNCAQLKLAATNSTAMRGA